MSLSQRLGSVKDCDAYVTAEPEIQQLAGRAAAVGKPFMLNVANR